MALRQLSKASPAAMRIAGGVPPTARLGSHSRSSSLLPLLRPPSLVTRVPSYRSDPGPDDQPYKRRRVEQPPRQQQRRQQEQQQQHQQRRWRANPDVSGVQFLVTCHPGLEQEVAKELQQNPLIGAQDITVDTAAVSFRGRSLAAGYRACLWLRCATRVLAKLYEANVDPARPAGDTVYEHAREAANWADLLQPGQSMGVQARVWSNESGLTNSQLVQRRVRDAVCDAVRDARGERPAPPEGVPHVPLHVTVLHDVMCVYRDLSGTSLHRRGYRGAMHKASLNEAAAAGLLSIAGWGDTCTSEGTVLADPMCGSGGLTIEAALWAANIAPGLLRPSNTWACSHWPDYDARQWSDAADEAEAARRPIRCQILGNDIHEGALGLALRDATAADVARAIRLHAYDVADWVPPVPPTLVVTNPPWGLRLMERGRGDDRPWQSGDARHASSRRSSQQSDLPAGHALPPDQLAATWRGLSHFLKQRCKGADAWLLSGHADLTAELGMRAAKKRVVVIGGVKTAWLRYNIYPGEGGRLRNAPERGPAYVQVQNVV